MWSELPPPEDDKIFGIAKEYRNDKTHEQKVNLSIGAYVDESGKAICFKSVQKAMSNCAKDPEVGYLMPRGDLVFCELSQKLLFSVPEVDDRIVSIQAPSGTGALTVAANLCKELFSRTASQPVAYVSNPTWPIHKTLFGVQCGYVVKEYGYWDAAKLTIDDAKFRSDMDSANEHSVIITHACAHNPTGQDLSHEQWEFVFDVCRRKQHILVIDCAYQGFASGDFERDAWAVRRAYEIGVQTENQKEKLCFIVCQSYAKNMGLYGHRCGCCHIFAPGKESAEKVLSMASKIARRIWSNPPRMGSDVVKAILLDPQLKQEWIQELQGVSEKIRLLRAKLRTALEQRTPMDWAHLTNQIGMFAYTGLRPDQCKRLRAEYGVYLLDTGRISVPGCTFENIDYIADSISSVLNC
ncbi:aspartate aminotransferase [Gregarina niphandrodes]|uniref:Aspartate aminotransferase n=1 Tax=Gregarina niphandrodes TaxID=110365 RepID=A0A023BBH7_GRENI|nr:aspartate aminotransferase [Gregarina niphandrodes]EZG79270.1 aspartate aminotransferase [Gregarina niphandrodes]|eukprot:XP_011129087.1 aspartate aminotransferase [Gregarina niphandrodes]